LKVTDGSLTRQSLSAELRPVYDLEIELANEVSHVEEPAGSSCPYSVIFKRPLHLEAIHERLTLPSDVKFWESRDPHYSIEAGFYCETSRHSIAGPIGESSDFLKWLKMFVKR
jgi:hypothetical protein